MEDSRCERTRSRRALDGAKERKSFMMQLHIWYIHAYHYSPKLGLIQMRHLSMELG